MVIEERFELLEEILGEWKEVVGADFEGYKNHVYRMINFCLSLKDCSDVEREKIIIAACFHDIGIWVAHTADYIQPSVPPAMAYLKNRNLEGWSSEIESMITQHHKITEYTDKRYPLTEVFRKGDLVDFSLGLINFGVSRRYIKRVKAMFPNKGFHKKIVKLEAGWVLRHPLNPVPMMKW